MTKTVEFASAFVRVTERGAIAAARTMGQGDRKYADQVSVEAIRRELDTVEVDGTIVIGEGERDEAPMLYVGEKVGAGGSSVDIAVDPLEGTSLCATGAANSISVLAAADKGGLFGAPDIYMEKLVVGPSSKGKVDINAPVEENLKAIAKALDLRVSDLVVAVLDRPRHERLVGDIRRAGARIRLIPDGDLSAGIAAAVVGTGVHALMGVGGAPEGVLTAAAMRCLNGEIQSKLVLTKPADGERLRHLGIEDPGKVYSTTDLASGKNVVLAATGVTDGALLKGVRFFGDGMRTHTVVMTTVPHQVRFIDTIHASNDPDVRIRF
jgi:fructose-1,6-bisphosphatase class II